MYKYVLLLHILGATVWTGGHLVLALAVLPRVLKERSPAALRQFESAYERVGMPALLLQVATGLWLAHLLVPDVRAWFTAGDFVSRLILFKLSLLAATVLVAADARLRIIPRLTAQTLPAMARRIVAVTVLSVLFVATGVAFRVGPLY
jgi:putative copper export protein